MKHAPIAFIGLGQMGEPMAHNLLKAGFQLTIYNRTRAKAESLARQGARVVDRPSQAITPDGIVVSMLANDAALEAVVLGPHGIAETLGEGGTHISMSTISPETARRLAGEHERHGSRYLAAPVFGRPEAAAAAKLWICVSGPDAAQKAAAPVLQVLGQGVHAYGEDPGAANVVKLAGNFLIASAIEALAEALALGEKNGIDRTALVAFFAHTIFACPIYQNYGRIIATEQYEPPGFKLALGMKDIGLVLDAGQRSQVPMPLASLLRDRLIASLAHGRQDLDWTAIALAASEDAGLKARRETKS
jgi:3-hydroxyisobutyrate dehydrogenase-like beta-hydroxyacid dehydrogenase